MCEIHCGCELCERFSEFFHLHISEEIRLVELDMHLKILIESSHYVYGVDGGTRVGV
jgi:hypothetical protein